VKRLKGLGVGRRRDEGVRLEGAQVVLELDHGHTRTGRRETVAGEDTALPGVPSLTATTGRPMPGSFPAPQNSGRCI
jgi:hypothetical protein